MTLNSSGPISLAGTTAGQSIELENGGNGTTQISLNDTAVRTLAGVPSGAITMPTNFWGKSNRASISYTFTTSTADASLNVTSIGGYVAGKSDITIYVNPSVYLWASSTGSLGLNIVGGTSGDALTIVNQGYIMGCGGNGGNGTPIATPSPSGGGGGPALSLSLNTTINNTYGNAYIGGGGGGGGAGGGGNFKGNPVDVAAGGGGGAGGGYGGNAYNLGNPNGGGIGSYGANGSTVSGLSSGPSYGGGAGGGGGAPLLNGAGGGRIFPGSGGAGGVYTSGGGGGNGGSANSGGGAGNTAGGGGGGGGWGASGGSGGNSDRPPGGGGGGGYAIYLNGHSITWVSGDTSRIYGAVG